MASMFGYASFTCDVNQSIVGGTPGMPWNRHHGKTGPGYHPIGLITVPGETGVFH
jgi:hypothetical protein